jgi:hypothetical protein
MEIETQCLTTCEVAADGGAISLGFVDSSGKPATIRLSLNQVGALVMTLPGLIDKALQTRYGDQSLRYAYPLASHGGRFFGLLLDPARAAERTRRSAGGAAAAEGDAGELGRLAG